jgi:hypothetical protein
LQGLLVLTDEADGVFLRTREFILALKLVAIIRARKLGGRKLWQKGRPQQTRLMGYFKNILPKPKPRSFG